MGLDEYAMVNWARKGDRDPVELILKVNRYLVERFGDDFEANVCNKKRISLQRPYLDDRVKEWTNDAGRLHTKLDARSGLSLGLTLNRPPTLDLPEVLVVSFVREAILQGDSPLVLERLLDLFKFLVRRFEPYWAGFYDEIQTSSNQIRDVRLRVNLQMVPASIDWFNYFGPAMAERMGGAEKLSAAPVFLVESIPDTGGVLMVLQREPFDYELESHKQHQLAVHEYLGLDELHRAYPK